MNVIIVSFSPLSVQMKITSIIDRIEAGAIVMEESKLGFVVSLIIILSDCMVHTIYHMRNKEMPNTVITDLI